MDRLVPLDGEPLPLDDEATQAIPTPEDTPPEPVVPGAPPTEESPALAPAPQQLPSYTLPKVPPLPEIKHAPEPVPETPKSRLEPVEGDLEEYTEPAPKEEDSWLDPKDYAIPRGLAEGVESLKGGKDFLTVWDLSFGNKSEEEKKRIILEQAPDTTPSGWERRVPSLGDIGSDKGVIRDIGTFIQESAGSAVVSTMPSVIGGVAGAAGGTALAGPVGALIGGYAGAALPSMALGLSGMYQDLRTNEGVRKALQDGTITADQFQKLTIIGGLMSGALDSIPASHFAGKALGLDMVKKEITETIIKAAIKGGLEEGGTESLQQMISEAGQGMGGGDTSIGQQAMNVLNAGVQGLIGGVVFGGATREKVPAKAGEDDEETIDEAGEAKPKDGVVLPPPDAVQNPPGDTSATTPKPPAGAPTAVTTDEAKPEVAEPAAGAVMVIEPGTVAADAASALAVGAPATPAAAPEQAAAATTTPVTAIPEDTGEFDIAAETEGQTGVDLAAHEQRIADIFARHERAQEQEKQAQTVTTADPNADIKQALGALVPAKVQPEITAPVIPTGAAPKPVTTENIGTGQGLGPAANVGEPVTEPVLQAGVSPTAPEAAQESESLPTPAPALVPAANKMAEPAPVSNAADVSQRRAQAALAFNKALATNDPEQVAAAKQNFLGVMEELRQVDPEQYEHFANTPGNKHFFPELQEKTAANPSTLVPLDEAPLPLTSEDVAAFTPEQKVERIPGKISIAPRAAPVPGEKGARFRKTKAEPVTAAPELATTREKASEAVAGQPEAETAPAPAPAADKAIRTGLSRDTAQHAIDLPEMQRSTVSELPEFRETLHDIAAEHVAENPRTEGQSPRDYIRKEAPKLVEKVKARLAKEEEAKAQEDIKAKEMLTVYGRKKHAKAAKAAEKAASMAAAEKPQQAERAGKKKGKSSEGIRTESPDSAYRAYKRELKKKPEDRSAALLKWGQLHERQLKVQKAGVIQEGEHAGRKAADVRAEIQEQKDFQKETRATEAEVEEAKGPQMSERAKAAEKAATPEIEKLPLPDLTGSPAEQLADANSYFARFIAATRKLALASHHDDRQSPAENLVIYARKVDRNDSGTGIGPTDFMVARKLYDEGAIEEMNDMVVSQQLQGGGYSESKGAGPKQSWTESEEIELRRHEEEQGYEIPEDTGEQALVRKGGRNAAWQQAEGQEEHEAQGFREERDITVTRPNGSKVTVSAETEKASGLLRSLNQRLNAGTPRWWRPGESTGGFWAMLRSAHIRHLMQLVGDVDVHFISREDMAKFGAPLGARGLYLNYTDEQRADGMKPMVFIDREERSDLDDYSHTLLHELTHAATSQAIRDDVRGTAKIIRTMMKGLEKQLADMGFSVAEQKALGLKYGFTNEYEFIAEAFSNRDFQLLLAKMPVSPELRREIGALKRGRPPTWWDALTAAVSNAIGMISGQRGTSYMEQVMSLAPNITRSSTVQTAKAREAVFDRAVRPLPRAVLSGPLDEQMLIRETDALWQGVKDKLFDTSFGEKRHALANKFATTDELIRRSVDWFGGIGNALERLGRAHLSRDSLLTKFRKNPGEGIDSAAMEESILDFKQAQPKEYVAAGHWMDDATRWQVNGAAPLSHPDNGHISKAGDRSNDSRLMHKELAERFAAFSPEGKKIIRQQIEHYRKTFEVENDAKVRHSLRQALKGYRKSLPAGKTIDDAIAWVRSGAAARAPEEQTAEDKAYHEALGSTAATLARIPELRKIKGVYAPMQRRGRYFITAKERPFGTMDNQKNVPPGAVMDAENRLLFTSKKDLQDFQDSFPGQVHVSFKWVDPATGKKIHHKEINAARLYVATVQNQRMEMSDSKSKLRARAAELAGQGHQVSALRISKKELYQAAEEISAPQIKALIRNLEQTTLGRNTAGQEAIKAAVLDAQIRTLNSPGRLERHLKRRNVLGNETDMLGAMRDYNRTLASALANYKLAPELAEADQELEKYINDEAHKDYSDNKTMVRQIMASELRKRIKDTQYVSGPKFLQVSKDITALVHLASPHFSIMQAFQPYMITMPILSAKYGRGAAWREMMKVHHMGGTRKVLGKGFRETWNAGKSLIPYSKAARQGVSHDDFWRDLVKGQPDEALLNKVFDEVVELGFGATSGVESQAVSEQDRTKAGIALGRLVNVARAMPEAMESINRYQTAIATVRLAKLKGLSDEMAIREAALTVGETQGGYGAANNPAFFSNPWMSAATQFRKFSLAYGQLFYRNLVWSFAHADPETRKVARKSVARLALTTTAMAGVYGLPLVEIARTFVNVAAMLGLKDDDWDKEENDFQAWFAGMLKSTGHGEEISEALLRGAPRLANLDLSGTFGTDNLAMFGQPDTFDPKDLKAWLMNSLLGAPGGVATNMLKSIQQGDYLGAIPVPKMVKNIKDAYQLATKGTVDKKTGEQYMDPVSGLEAAYKLTGFRTASEARQWESGGSGFEFKVERQERSRRRTLMGQWSNSDPGERARIFREDVREWNKAHKDPKMRIDMGDLQRSKKERQRQRKEREKERED